MFLLNVCTNTPYYSLETKTKFTACTFSVDFSILTHLLYKFPYVWRLNVLSFVVHLTIVTIFSDSRILPLDYIVISGSEYSIFVSITSFRNVVEENLKPIHTSATAYNLRYQWNTWNKSTKMPERRAFENHCIGKLSMHARTVSRTGSHFRNHRFSLNFYSVRLRLSDLNKSLCGNWGNMRRRSMHSLRKVSEFLWKFIHFEFLTNFLAVYSKVL